MHFPEYRHLVIQLCAIELPNRPLDSSATEQYQEIQILVPRSRWQTDGEDADARSHQASDRALEQNDWHEVNGGKVKQCLDQQCSKIRNESLSLAPVFEGRHLGTIGR